MFLNLKKIMLYTKETTKAQVSELKLMMETKGVSLTIVIATI